MIQEGEVILSDVIAKMHDKFFDFPMKSDRNGSVACNPESWSP
jgi:hypothetical protein